MPGINSETKYEKLADVACSISAVDSYHMYKDL